MLYATKLNPHLETARQHSKDWARRMGMLNTLPGFPDIFIWDDHKFDVADVALCGALIHPNGSAPELDTTACWLVWGTYADDFFPAIYGYSRDMVGAKVFHARLPAFMPDDLTTIMAVPTSPIERGLADLWARTAVSMTLNARRQFRQAILDMTESWLWELANHIQDRVPDPVDYVEMRRKTFGSTLTMSLSRLTYGDAIPPEIFKTRTMQGIDNSAADYNRRLLEFADGSIEVLPMPTDRHQTLSRFLLFSLFTFVQPLGGTVLYAPLRLQIREARFREPDLLVVRDANDPRRHNQFWRGADLVVEIVSPDDPERDTIVKRADYAEARILLDCQPDG
jgi:hypothetical protein